MSWIKANGEHVHARLVGKRGRDQVWGFRVLGYSVDDTDGTHDTMVLLEGGAVTSEELEGILGKPKRRIELVPYPVQDNCCDLYERGLVEQRRKKKTPKSKPPKSKRRGK